MDYQLIERDTNVVGQGKGMIFVDGKYYLLSYNPAKVCVSEDLETWVEYQLDGNFVKPLEITYGNGKFVICGESQVNGKICLYTSTSGMKWDKVTINVAGSQSSQGFNFSFESLGIRFVNNKFITFCEGWRTTYRTNGVITKIESYIPVFESTNGTNWNQHNIIETYSTQAEYDSKYTYAYDIDYFNGLYILIGLHGNIYTSPNLVNWAKRSSGVANYLRSIITGKSKAVIVGDNGIILTSNNGTNWSKQNSETTSSLMRIRYANGTFFACGYNGTILISLDGISWKNIIPREIGGLLYSMSYDNIHNRIVIGATYYTNSGTIPIFYCDLTRELSEYEDEDSSLFFFNEKFDLLGIIDYFISLRWRRKYFEAGDFEIILPVTNYVMNLIDPYVKDLTDANVLILRNNYTEAGIIENIEFSDNGTDEEVTISGRFLSSILERRIIKSRINFNGNTIEGMNTLINAMTPISADWETESVTMESPSINFQCTYKNVYEYMIKLSKYSNVGFRVVPNIENKVYMFEVYKGLDRTVNQDENEQYSFSDDNYNIEQGSLTISSKTKVNYVLVGGTGEGTARIIETVDKNKSGFDRYEVFSDQKGLSNQNLSDSEYRSKLRQVGEGLISDGTFQLEVTALVQQDYKDKWDLGDIVNIKKNRWGVVTSYRIIEVEEIIEDGKRTIYPTFGSPLGTAWEDDK